MTFIAIFVSLIFLHSLVSVPLERSVLTAPIVFTGAGMVAPLCLPELHEQRLSIDVWLIVAEGGLVLLLFTDASRTDLRLLNSIRGLPARLLSMGMLLTIVPGALGALAEFPQLSLWEAGMLAAILAPTDAGLGQIIVNSPHAPLRIRQALNVEAGLNDGLSVPFMLFFMMTAAYGSPFFHRLPIRARKRLLQDPRTLCPDCPLACVRFRLRHPVLQARGRCIPATLHACFT
jgi:NhaP-type Na+/H+ or K+/H+ antiporter